MLLRLPFSYIDDVQALILRVSVCLSRAAVASADKAHRMGRAAHHPAVAAGDTEAVRHAFKAFGEFAAIKIGGLKYPLV